MFKRGVIQQSSRLHGGFLPWRFLLPQISEFGSDQKIVAYTATTLSAPHFRTTNPTANPPGSLTNVDRKKA
jgi:hypothetical protein